MTPKDVLSHIDHALLAPTLDDRAFERGCALAKSARVAALCVKSVDVARAKRILGAGELPLCAVVGFPHGNVPLGVLCREAEQAMTDGATEIDMVVCLSRALSGDWEAVEQQVASMNALVTGGRGRLKVILETGLIAEVAVKRHLCAVCREVGVAFVKTSTGFATRTDQEGRLVAVGATPSDVALLVAEVRPRCEVKASGGIRTLADVCSYLRLGATRIGTASTESILQELGRQGEETTDGADQIQ
jgi:deoxyribose-phosphate aldolase